MCSRSWVEGDMDGPRVRPGLERHHPASPVVLLHVDRVGTRHDESQPAPPRHPAGDPVERVELVAVDVTRVHEMLSSEGVAIARAQQVARQKHALAVGADRQGMVALGEESGGGALRSPARPDRHRRARWRGGLRAPPGRARGSRRGARPRLEPPGPVGSWQRSCECECQRSVLRSETGRPGRLRWHRERSKYHVVL